MLAGPGWGQVKASLCTVYRRRRDARAGYVHSDGAPRGKKTVLAPRCSRSLLRSNVHSGIAANFLCDNSGYIWEQTIKGKPQRSVACLLRL